MGRVAAPEVEPSPVDVFVTVGTDKHPFDRLSIWLDRWLESRGDQAPLRCLCQTGNSKPPRGAEHHDYLGYEQMEAAARAARVIVTHGGPATIMLAVALGKRPVVVPRTHALGEHVDDHQRAFGRRVASDGSVFLAETEDEFRSTMDGLLSGRLSARARVSPGVGPERTVQRFERLVDGLFAPREEATGTPGTVVDLARRPPT